MIFYLMKIWKMKKIWFAKCGYLHACEIVKVIIFCNHTCKSSNNNSLRTIILQRPCAFIYLMIFSLKIKVVFFAWKLNYI
jgi:hypothetical protein